METKPKTSGTTSATPPKFSNVVVYPIAGLSRWYIATGFLQHFPNYPKDSLGRIQYHTGLDYNLKTGGNTDIGEEVYAVADGIIEDASVWTGLPGFGNILKISHPQFGVWTRYGHLLKFAKGISKGMTVRAGQLIGYVGKSGTKLAHLHFDVLKEQRPTRFWGATDKALVIQVYEDTLPWLKNHRAGDVGDA